MVIDVFYTENPKLALNIERSATYYEKGIQGALKAALMSCECSGYWFYYKEVV